jgi:hypothetical protein
MGRTFNVNNLPRGYRQDSDYGRVRDTGTYVGIVKKNTDAQRMGRIAVYIPELGGDPTDETNWFVVSYASPFAGVTPPSGLVQNGTGMTDAQSSYGFWMIPPDLDNQVLVVFANGMSSKGFWFACVWQQNMNHMVPGIASATPTVGGEHCGSLPPTVEYNKWSTENPDNPKRPVFEPLDGGLSSQGLYHDPERGPTTASARREAPSKVFGYSTPRGNQLYVDDNPANEFIRMRTRSGAQVLINETTGFVYINSKEGHSWVEISDIGVDIYSRGAVSLRSEGSLNLHADGSLNIEADGNLNLRAGGNLTLQSAHHTNLAGNGDLVLDLGGTASMKAGSAILLDTGGSLKMGAGGTISQASGGSNIRSAASIQDNTSTAAPAPGAPSAVVEAPRSLPEVNGEAPCYTQDTRMTITRRMPTHEPWTGHPSAGVATTDVDATNLSPSEFASPTDVANTTSNSIVAPASNTNITATDLDWLACCMLDEASNQSDVGKAAVAQVVKNRMAVHQSSDGTVKGTVLWPNQFSGFYFANVGGKYSRVCSDGACAEQRGLQKIATYQKNAAAWNNAKNIGSQVMAGTYNSGDAIFGKLTANKRATMYLNVSATKKLNTNGLPSWATASKLVGDIGAHSFYYA